MLPYVHQDAEAEVRAVFDQVIAARAVSTAASEVADRLLFETVVRLHRAGEGAPYTGLKPAGLDVGPVIPVAERAVVRLDETEVVDLLAGFLAEELAGRMRRLRELGAERDGSVAKEREYVEAVLGFEVHSHRLYQAMRATSLH